MAYSGERLYIYEGYVAYIDSYRIVIPKYRFHDWIHNLEENKPLTPEITGYILGLSTPMYMKVFCEVCKKNIKEEDSVRRNAPNSPINGQLLPVCKTDFEALKPDEKQKT